MARMKQLAFDQRITINTSVYLKQERIKAIIELRFNPGEGEGVAHLVSAGKGLFTLACRARSMLETERIRKHKRALTATKKTRQLRDLLQLPKGTTWAPADNYWELKINNIATYMGLPYVLFGSQCDYYHALRQVYRTLKMKEVYAIKVKFTPKTCRRITWAILDDGRAFFDGVKISLDFESAELMYPQLYLIGILNDIRFSIRVQRTTFSDEWVHHKLRLPDEGQRLTGGPSGGQPPSGVLHGKGPALKRKYQAAPGGPPTFDPYRGQQQGHGSLGMCDSRAGWVDNQHPKIKNIMDQYLENFHGRLHLVELLDAAGKRQSDLPRLPCFTNSDGCPFLCWNSTLGRCTFRGMQIRSARGPSWARRYTQQVCRPVRCNHWPRC
jgi:hypothetical protein